MKKDIERVKKILKEQKAALREKYGVSEIGVFGSYVKGKQKKKSDLDVLVEFNIVPGFFKFIKLEDYLSSLLKIKVDLVRKKALRKELKPRILSEVVFV